MTWQSLGWSLVKWWSGKPDVWVTKLKPFLAGTRSFPSGWFALVSGAGRGNTACSCVCRIGMAFGLGVACVSPWSDIEILEFEIWQANSMMGMWGFFLKTFGEAQMPACYIHSLPKCIGYGQASCKQVVCPGSSVHWVGQINTPSRKWSQPWATSRNWPRWQRAQCCRAIMSPCGAKNLMSCCPSELLLANPGCTEDDWVVQMFFFSPFISMFIH